VHGGLVQGIAQALFEEAVFDDAGTLVSASFVDYLVPTAADTISFDVDHTTTPSTLTKLGTKGVGETGAIASTPAVVNAVLDAVRHYGVKDIQMPCTPERIWKAIHERGAGGDEPTVGDAVPHFDEKDVADRTDGAGAGSPHSSTTSLRPPSRTRSRPWPRAVRTPRCWPVGRACCRSCACGSTPRPWWSTSGASPRCGVSATMVTRSSSAR
jgi:hypothetical protein